MKHVLLVLVVFINILSFSLEKNNDNNIVINTYSFEDELEIINLVNNFGKKLKLVSLQSPKPLLIKRIKENYGEYVSKELINEWIQNPLIAPGRLVSSPWPEGIDVLKINKIGTNLYDVYGYIIEMTSYELVKGNINIKRPIKLQVKKINSRWIIIDVNMSKFYS